MKDISFTPPGIIPKTSKEKIHTIIFDSHKEAINSVAREIALLIQKKNIENKTCILGLATGSSPIPVYEELIRWHKEEKLSFKNVITFNLDEYYGLAKNDPNSYNYFMKHYLFDHIDILAENIHIPDGMISMDNMETYCLDYENKIRQLGGIDLQILGIGRTGHIGFNEPGSFEKSVTRIVALDTLTKQDAKADFESIEKVPSKAITIGINTILNSKRILLIAWGEQKATAIAQAIEGECSSVLPASFLQKHPNTTFILDKGASSLLTQYQTPWLVESPCWDNLEQLKKGVIWLSGQTQKPILKLIAKDYSDYSMGDLILQYGNVHDLNIKIFNAIQHTITGWPGGKPFVDDSQRPERATPTKKRVLLFSPHPDDDVISMGGTFMRLCEQGHEVHVAYQTSGNIAVSNTDTYRYIEFGEDFEKKIGVAKSIFSPLKKLLENINSYNIPKEILTIKGLIRRQEAKAGARFSGIKNENQIHFLEMPFYDTGTIKKNSLSKTDISIIEDLILKIRPHQIYAAGDLADPHGTHKICLDAIFQALDNLKNYDFIKDCWVWLYRGAWQEWPIHEIDMAVPMSPDQVQKKQKAIFFHESQKDGVMFQGDDNREFWQRAQQRNYETAEAYYRLGFANYAAMEAFKRYHF